MNEQLYETTKKATSHRRLGSIPGCLALNSADLGEAVVDGKTVTITWGRNLDKKSQEYYANETKFAPVHVGAYNGSAELIIPPKTAEILRSILTP